ncbi:MULTISPECIES: lytic transglycosylase domain-containing protein [unclassified Novosphingobium]|uniref:lytic transglycosylase domain-containing protein n=1 Tax=unclassified Novosphingobium TaxID=2644732 RepID=UPI000A904A77|nr:MULTISPECIES: lytic transglycosylase domain-containing protein [unclassified Novosphingobium]
MKNPILASLAVFATLTGPSQARTISYLDFQPPKQVQPALDENLVDDFHNWASAATERVDSQIALPTQSNCTASHWKPLGLKPVIELRRARYFPAMVYAACAHGIPVDLFDALIIQESGYSPLAQSNKGAAGLTQLMPDTAKSQGITNVWNVDQNLAGGARVLKAHLAEFGRYDLALAAYNAGPGRVRPRHSVPAITETQAYVSAILSRLERNAIHRENMALADRQNDRLHVIAF